MLDLIRKYYFYLILINITLSANAWSFLGISIGQLVYWFILLIGVRLLLKTGYSRLALLLFFITFILKLFGAIFIIPFLANFSEFSSGAILILVGSCLYAENPIIIYRQLITFFAISIPFMILQKIGVHTFFYGWSTELFHENSTYSFDIQKDIGVFFKNISLFPTLFVELKDLTYVMYQGRPTGLLYSNNVLSVIISLALALHYSIRHNIKGNLKYLIIASISVLTMSTLVYGVLVLLFIYYYFINRNKKLKWNALKTICFTLVMLIFHFIFFPGLTTGGIGLINLISFVTRFDEIFQALGFNYFEEFVVLQGMNLNFEEQSYSSIGQILELEINYLIMIIIFSFLFLRAYLKSFKKHINQRNIYITLFIVCILTQFALNFLRAPSFQLMLGIALFPLFKSSIFSSQNKI